MTKPSSPDPRLQQAEILRDKAKRERQAAKSRREAAAAYEALTPALAREGSAIATAMTGTRHRIGNAREWKESARIDRACAIKCDQLADACDAGASALLRELSEGDRS